MMKTEAFVFTFLVVFFGIVAPVYWIMSKEPTGTTALVLTFTLVLMLAGYIWLLERKLPKRPEDRKDGEIIEGAGELVCRTRDEVLPRGRLDVEPLGEGDPRRGLRGGAPVDLHPPLGNGLGGGLARAAEAARYESGVQS